MLLKCSRISRALGTVRLYTPVCTHVHVCTHACSLSLSHTPSHLQFPGGPVTHSQLQVFQSLLGLKLAGAFYCFRGGRIPPLAHVAAWKCHLFLSLLWWNAYPPPQAAVFPSFVSSQMVTGQGPAIGDVPKIAAVSGGFILRLKDSELIFTITSQCSPLLRGERKQEGGIHKGKQFPQPLSQNKGGVEGSRDDASSRSKTSVPWGPPTSKYGQ